MRLPRVRDQRLRQSLLPSARRQAATRARAHRSLRRAPAAPSTAASSRAAFPVRAASDTLSKPPTARPARRARPTASIQRCARRASTRSAMSADTTTGRRAARANSRLATARSTISRRGVNHKPRPGSRAATSGTSSPLGPMTKRSRRNRSQISPVTMQRRWAPSLPASALHPGVAVPIRRVVAPTPAYRMWLRLRTSGRGRA